MERVIKYDIVILLSLLLIFFLVMGIPGRNTIKRFSNILSTVRIQYTLHVRYYILDLLLNLLVRKPQILFIYFQEEKYISLYFFSHEKEIIIDGYTGERVVEGRDT